MDKKTLSDKTTLRELGQRIARHRLNKNMTQHQLATESGVSRATLQRIEAGESQQVSTLIRLLRALDLLGNMDALVPVPPMSPLQQLKMSGKIRRRASTKDKERAPDVWSWGDQK